MLCFTFYGFLIISSFLPHKNYHPPEFYFREKKIWPSCCLLLCIIISGEPLSLDLPILVKKNHGICILLLKYWNEKFIIEIQRKILRGRIKKKTVKFKIVYLKWSSLRTEKKKRMKKKWIEAKGLKGHHQQHKNIQSLSCRRRGDWGMGRKKK